SLGFTLKVTDGGGLSDTQTLTVNIGRASTRPKLSAAATAYTVTDTLADDTFADVSVTLSTLDRDVGDSATYSIDAGVAGSYLAGAYDSAKAGTYGTLYLNSTCVAYKRVPNGSTIFPYTTLFRSSLGFTLKVTDGGGLSDTQTLTLN